MKPTRTPAFRTPMAQTIMFAVYGVAFYAEILGGAYFALDRVAEARLRQQLDNTGSSTLYNTDGRRRTGWVKTSSVTPTADGGFHFRGSLTPPPGASDPNPPPPVHVQFPIPHVGDGHYRIEYRRPGGGSLTGGGIKPSAVDVATLALKPFVLPIIVASFLGLFVLVVWAKLLSRGGYPQWYALVPGVNVFYVMRMAVDGLPKAWLMTLGSFVPGVNAVVWVLASLGLAKRFGRSGVFAAGLIMLPVFFVPALAFGKPKYRPHGVKIEEEDLEEEEEPPRRRRPVRADDEE